MRFAERLYELGVRAGRAALIRLPLRSGKLRRSVRGRRGLIERLEAWARSGRGNAPLVWVHAPSVGEGLQTGPVIEALRGLRPDLQIFYTFFSSSAEGLAARLPVDHADYLPFDVRADVAAALEAVRPAVIVFGKADVWPVTTRVAAERGIRSALISATLAPNSSRLRWPVRAALAPAYRRLDAVGAIAREDAERLVRLGVRPERLSVTGDARFDQVRARADAIDRSAPPLSLLERPEGVTLTAGSTWPEGEKELLPALVAILSRHPELRVILAPHEPTPGHLAALESALADRGVTSTRLSRVESGDGRPTTVVLVDRVGVLAELYALAEFAYVGGGFGTRGLHSVLEPAALGVPVLFGPRHANAREAAELLECGGALEVADAAGLESALEAWLADPGRRWTAGSAARAYVDANLGAARRNAELVLGLLEGAQAADSPTNWSS